MPRPVNHLRRVSAGGRIPVVIIATLAIESVAPALATDIYTPAFPRVTTSLATQPSLVGATVTAFFLGLGVGQLLGGPFSDQHGRRRPLIVGGLLCTLGAVVCAVSPSIGVLLLARVVQGIGGGVAAVVARAIAVDIASGDQLARVISLLMAFTGIGPIVAPVVGAGILTVADWRTLFWFLAAFGVLMLATAVLFVPETLPPALRHGGGLRHSVEGIRDVMQNRVFVRFMATASCCSFTIFAYIATSSYVLQGLKGLTPFEFAAFFGFNGALQVTMALVNGRLVGRRRPERLIALGQTGAAVAVSMLTVGVLLWGTPLVLTCVGFVVLVTAQVFITSNATALVAGAARRLAGSAAAVQGVVQAVVVSLAAPLASAGGSSSAVPMVIVMTIGVALSVASFRLLPGAVGPSPI